MCPAQTICGDEADGLLAVANAGIETGRVSTHPAIRDRVLTERWEIREHVNVFVGKSEARTTGGLTTPLADGTEISIIPAISGG